MPTARLLQFPPAYGRPTQTIDWAMVRRRLEEAQAYWLATSRPDGRPHVVPLDGLWVDDAWWYGGDPRAVHVRNVEERPRVVMHLADPMQAVIVEGTVRRLRPDPDLAQRLADASNTKYAHYGRKTAATYREALGLFPVSVLAWTAYPTDATRFDFTDETA